MSSSDHQPSMQQPDAQARDGDETLKNVRDVAIMTSLPESATITCNSDRSNRRQTGKSDIFHDDQQQELEDYVNELVPALRMVYKSNHINMEDIYQRQKAFKVTADAVLARRGTGMSWSRALSERAKGMPNWSMDAFNERSVLDDGRNDEASICVGRAEGNDVDNVAGMAMRDMISIDEEEMWKGDVECDSSSCMGTPILSDGQETSSAYCELANEHDHTSALHRQRSSTASLAISSDHSISCMVESASEPMQDKIMGGPALNHAALSRVTHPAAVDTAREGAVLLNCVQSGDCCSNLAKNICSCCSAALTSCQVPAAADDDEKSHARSPSAIAELYKEINARLVLIRGCSKEWNEGDVDAGNTMSSEVVMSENMESNWMNNIMIDPMSAAGTIWKLVKHDDVARQRSVALRDHAEVAAGNADVAYEGWPYSAAALQYPGTAVCQLYQQTMHDVAGGAAGAMGGPSVDVEVGHVGAGLGSREIMYRAAAFRPIDWEEVRQQGVGKERPRRRNVRISKEPQSVAARQRRERISDRIRILQRLVPGANKLDTASMLDEAIHYLKFLKLQVQALRRLDKLYALSQAHSYDVASSFGASTTTSSSTASSESDALESPLGFSCNVY